MKKNKKQHRDRICPKCGAVNPKVKFEVYESSFETCRNIIKVKKILGLFDKNIKCNEINWMADPGITDYWIYKKHKK